MKLLQLLPLASLATALVLPEQEVFADLEVETTAKSYLDKAEDALNKGWNSFENTVEEAADQTNQAAHDFYNSLGNDLSDKAEQVSAWAEEEIDLITNDYNNQGGHHHHPHKPHDPHKKHEPNETVYQLIAGSKYTTKLAGLINKYPDLVDALNGTSTNFTVFAPTDKAFEKIPKDAPEPTEEELLAVLSYHVIPDFYPAGRVLVSNTAPTLYKEEQLGRAQRIGFEVGLRGLMVNFYSRVIAINIFGTNGVIHGVDSLLIPPPRIAQIIDWLPSEFSTLELGLVKTELFDKLNETERAGTFFAPTNLAFAKLGPKINGFLFSQNGLKYLKALLKYHAVPGPVLYSDAFFDSKDDDESDAAHTSSVYHYDLKTALDGKSISIDVARYGAFTSMKANGFVRVSTNDGIAANGVMHSVNDVIIPPRNGQSDSLFDRFDAEMDLEEFKARLEPLV